MRNSFWHYQVKWFFDGENHFNQGFVCAENFAEAASKIDLSYDDIESMTIVGLDAYDVLDFEDILDMMGAHTEGSTLGPQLIAALEEAIAITKEGENA